MKRLAIHPATLVALLIGAVALVIGYATGHPVLSPEMLASIGMLPLAIGNTEAVTEIKSLLEVQGKAWEEFKSTNDTRLKAIESKGFAPADLEEKLGKINGDLNKLGRDIDDLVKKSNRPGAGKSDDDTPAEYKSGLNKYMRQGDRGDYSAEETKAMSSQSDPDGGYLVTAEMDAQIDRVATVEMAFATLATTRNIGKSGYKKLVKKTGVSGGWVGEAEDSTESSAPNYAEIEIPVHRVYAEPWIPNDLLEDAEYDLEMELADEAGITFGEKEGDAFINGDGVKKPRGILAYDTVANASYAWGKVGYLKTGVSGGFAASNPADDLIKLQHALKQRYRGGAAFLMNDATLGTVRQFKDGATGFYLWQPDSTAGFGGRLLGSPVSVDDYMPDLGTNSLSIAYGDFKRAYTIVRRRGIAVIRDNVTKKGTTKLHLSRRTGGGVINFEAFKLLKFAA